MHSGAVPMVQLSRFHVITAVVVVTVMTTTIKLALFTIDYHAVIGRSAAPGELQCLSTLLGRDPWLGVTPGALAPAGLDASVSASTPQASKHRKQASVPVPVHRATLRRPTLRARCALALQMFARSPRP